MMDPQLLADVAMHAIGHTLRYHAGPDAKLDEDDKAIVRDSIRKNFPLRQKARDIHVANLEIACEAAAAFAGVFNDTHFAPDHINVRWFYICVQALLCIELKPELLHDGEVARLSLTTDQEPSRPSNPDHATAMPSSAEEAPSPYSRESSAEQSITAADGALVGLKSHGLKWRDDEIQQIIQLKNFGLTHKAIAERLGRTKSAIDNKYNHLTREDWGK